MPIQPTDDPEIKSMEGIHLYHFSQSNYSMRIRRVMKWIDKLVNRPSYEAPVVKWFDYVPAHDQG